mmetsp:Transcript_33437/g.49849  ORF Transcript_33437/g.49849 Transcript_33437/m.49849 type:complete len:440 (-) Transcript_33437:114-1433(-)
MKFTGVVISIFSCLLCQQVHGGKIVDDVEFSWSEATLPFPVSDVMANFIPDPQDEENGGFIIITGGCDSIKGNERANFGDGDLFACFSTSTKTLKFDPFTEQVKVMADMPNERQRHAAGVVNGKLVVIGGRDSNDELVSALDVYDPVADEWTTLGIVPDDLVTSDLTAWSYEGSLFVTGGFIADYTAVGNTYRIDFNADATAVTSYVSLNPSPNPRGDFHAIEYNGYAYLAGGITHEGGWCEGLKTTERYSIKDDAWETLADLDVGRADMAVALLNGKILAMGGESKPDDCLEIQDPAYGSFPQDDVEVLLNPAGAGADSSWDKFGDLPDQRFRFAAATVPPLNRVYTFGGQLPLDFTCDCFPTNNRIAVGMEVLREEDASSGLGSGAIAGIVIAALVAVALIVGLLLMLRKTEARKESVEAQLAIEQEAKAKHEGEVE